MDLDTRMKLYEQLADNKLMPQLPTLARVDGRTFHSFTRHMTRPFDDTFGVNMVKLAKYLAEYFNSLLTYAQSDEISLLWLDCEPIWGGRINKIVSDLAATASSYFGGMYFTHYPELPKFDARVWVVPNQHEVANYFLWREQDATRNSISMVAQALYSHNQLYQKSTDDMQEMIYQRGVNWNTYPEHFKRGTYIKKVEVVRPFTKLEIDLLPPKHEARTNPNLEITRHEFKAMYPCLSKMEHQERLNFIFNSGLK